jgi:hypothetical protein
VTRVGQLIEPVVTEFVAERDPQRLRQREVDLRRRDAAATFDLALARLADPDHRREAFLAPAAASTRPADLLTCRDRGRGGSTASDDARLRH